MKKQTRLLGKIMYAAIFLLLVPAGLYLWAQFTEPVITLPAIQSSIAGGILMLAGVVLILSAMFYLKKYGKGLPMNAYPPPVFVIIGPYRLFHHPIYWGFGLLITGWFIYTGSASGFWLVSPVTILGMIALVMGFEGPDIRQRFPGQRTETILDFPKNDTNIPGHRDRLASVFWLLLFLFTCNVLTTRITGHTEPVFGEPLPLFNSLKSPYFGLLSIAFVIIVPFFLKQQTFLRQWLIAGLISLLFTCLAALLSPATGAQYLSQGPVIIFSVPLVLVFISLRSLFKQSGSTAYIFAALALVILYIQLVNSRSAHLYFLESVLLFFLSYYYRNNWLLLKNVSEKIANSWQEWLFGKVRIINHGFYVGVGAFIGVLLAGTLAGKEYAIALLIFNIIVTLCAALWAQFIEGSEKLKRPFGYYGGLAGILFGSIVIWLMGYDVWVILGVVSVAMPWVQAIGRLRCLVNGCCHGRRTDNTDLGIRYTHPRSRVCNISGLKGELLHPTQLYSILWLTLTGIVLLPLWMNGFSSSFIFGLYLILTSLGRFVEEAYRGESQTPVLQGLRLYQWTAVIALVIGIIMSTINIQAPVLNPGFSWESLVVAALTGLFIFIAMGVDFPYSNARFSRLV